MAAEHSPVHDAVFVNPGGEPAADSASRANKITVVGVGQVGMACAYTLLSQEQIDTLVLSDIMRDKLVGEVMDLQHAGAFLTGSVCAASPDFAETQDSDIIIVTAGVRQREGESRRDLLKRNVDVFRGIVPPLAKLSPKAVFLVVSNPVDIMTYVTWKLSKFPVNQVIGSGTYLDSSRFRVMLAQKLGVSAQSVHAQIIGEHGDSSVPLWSGVNVAGLSLLKAVKESPGSNEAFDEEQWKKVHDDVKNSAYNVIKLKGYTNWAIGAAVGRISRSILHNERRIMPVTTNVKGLYGITEDCFLSLPCVVGRAGLCQIIRSQLNEQELQGFRASATTLMDLQKSIEPIN